MDRRSLLATFVKAIGASVAAAVGVPALLYALAPATASRDRARWQPVGALSSFPVGGVRKATVRRPPAAWPGAFPAEGVFVWRPSPGEVVVFSRTCTDLGCPVEWDAGSEWFFCPCHGGVFAKDGTPKAGPPPRPLYRYATRIRDGRLEIDLTSLPPHA